MKKNAKSEKRPFISHGDSNKILVRFFLKYKKIFKVAYAIICDIKQPKIMTVNPWHTSPRVELHIVNVRYTKSRIYENMRHVAVFRRETVVLQMSKICWVRYTAVNIWHTLCCTCNSLRHVVAFCRCLGNTVHFE